jgi:hypothetical protein
MSEEGVMDVHGGPAEQALVGLAVALGASRIRGWTAAEERLAREAPRPAPATVEIARERILAGGDPLGELFCAIRPPAERRVHGATFTPRAIVAAMLDCAERLPAPQRVVDPGIGSGRFALAAGARFRRASIVGIEVDPLPALLARANLAVAGLEARAEVVLADYRAVVLPPIQGRTLYIGNPPYVRHHQIEPRWKAWLVREARGLGLSASQLAGLHVHFFLATAANAAPGDTGIFITAAEWLDVNYGRLVRELFLGALGGRGLVVIEPAALPFPDAATTAVITAFQVGSRPRSARLKRAGSLDDLNIRGGARTVRRDRLEAEPRWSRLTRPARKVPPGYVELGELCRVHRGQVTGANKVWIAGPHSRHLPESVLLPTVTKAKELFMAGKVLEDPAGLRRVIDLPADLDEFEGAERLAIRRFLARAQQQGAHETYIAANRKVWWSVGLRDPAPILATYMARRPPAFVRNRAAARHINIAHGLYPREPLDDVVLRNLAEFLAGTVQMTEGRTYAGGLTKFEPREMERLLVPGPALLSHASSEPSRDAHRAPIVSKR